MLFLAFSSDESKIREEYSWGFDEVNIESDAKIVKMTFKHFTENSFLSFKCKFPSLLRKCHRKSSRMSLIIKYHNVYKSLHTNRKIDNPTCYYTLAH